MGKYKITIFVIFVIILVSVIFFVNYKNDNKFIGVVIEITDNRNNSDARRR